MSDAPTRCCVPATSGRCANAPQPGVQSRYIGPVEIAACNLPKHQKALWSLPSFTRREGYCGADGCCKVAPSGLCVEHFNLYRRHGVLPRLLLATEPAPMPTPAATVEMPAVQPPPPNPAPPHAVAPPPRGILDRATGPGTDGASDGEEVEPEPTAPGPTMAELQEQVRTLQAQLTAAKVNNAADLCDAALSGLRIVAESAPLAREAEAARARGIVQSLSETITAVTAALDADPERSPAYDDKDQPIPLPRRVEIALMPDGIGHSRGERRAHELEVKLGNLEAMDYPGQLQTAIAEIETACVMLRRLGGTSHSVPDLLMQVLSPEDRRAILEVEAAEWRAAIARMKARRVNPPTPEKLAEYAGKLARVEAQIAALDHSPDAGNMVS